MKKLLGFLCITLLLVGFSLSANAAPYTGADITINGKDRVDDLGTSGWDWKEIGNAIGCRSTGWVEFSADLEPGNWNIGLNAINWGGELPLWYTDFTIEFSIGSLPAWSRTLDVPASNTEVNNAWTNVDVVGGPDTFRFTWLNDAYEEPPGEDPRDANIQINSVFFDNTATASVPEPTTMLLLGSGIIGLAGFGRKKIFNK